MKVRCIANTGLSLPEEYLDPRVGYTKQLKFALTVGKEYTVYAFYEWQGQVWYYLCDDNYMYYPMKNPAPLFEVSDSRVSKYWRFNLSENGLLRIAFQEWFTDRYFYDKLTDQNEAEVLIFEKVKDLMDAEFESKQPAHNEAEKSLTSVNAG
jgi:hypothetical protein